MPDCDDCGSDVSHVWRHSAFESETRRRVRWVCRSCHPDLRIELAFEPKSGATGPTESTESTDPQLRSDGGRPGGVATRSPASGPAANGDCPTCSGDVVNGQGLYSCPDCGWTGAD